MTRQLEADTNPPRRTIRPGILAAGVLAVTAAVHSRALGGTFIWDDYELIVRQGSVHTIRILDYFRHPFWNGNPSYYRPLTTLTYAIDWKVWGHDAAGFHATNVSLHLLATALLFAVARAWGAPAIAAGAAALLFGTFPRGTESVSWISGRTDVLATVFALSALLLHSSERGAHARRIAAAGCVLLGLFAKEVAVATLPAIAVLEWTRARTGRSDGRWLLRCAPALVAVLVYLAARWSALHGQPGAPLEYYPHGLMRLVTIVEAVGHYALMVADPLRPRLQIGLLGRAEWLAVAAGGAALLGIAAIVVRRGVLEDAGSCAALLFAAVGIGLVLHVVQIPAGVVAADRFMYAPVAGIAIAGALSFDRLSRSARIAVMGLALAASPAFALATYSRIAEWNDDVRLWTVAVETTRPDNWIPNTELGNALYRAGRLEEALAAYVRASGSAVSATAQVQALANEAITLSDLGRLDEAAILQRRLVSLGAARALEHYNLGIVESRRMNFEDAIRELEAAIRLQPDHEEARAALASVRHSRDDWARLPPEQSTEPCEIAVRRAQILDRLGSRRRALEQWRRVLQAADASSEVVVTAAGHVALHTDTREEATSAIERARRAGMSHDDAHELERFVTARFDSGPRAPSVARR